MVNNNGVDGKADNANAETENNIGAEKFKAIIKEEKPTYNRGDEIKVIRNKGIKKVIVRNIYSRRLEDLTFSDLEMVGYTNPNLFVKEWEQEHSLFDKDKIVWIVVYVVVNSKDSAK